MTAEHVHIGELIKRSRAVLDAYDRISIQRPTTATGGFANFEAVLADLRDLVGE